MRGRGDAELARLAELQHGHVHRAQMRAAGIGKDGLASRLRNGSLHRTFPSVYLVGRPQRDQLGRMMAAALHFKGDGLVAARAAAHIWQLLDSTQPFRNDDPVDVLLSGRNAGRISGVRIHRTTRLLRQDVRSRRGIPVTSPARTLLDLAATLDHFELETALSIALVRRLVRRTQLIDVIARNPRAKGVGRLQGMLDCAAGPRETRSGYERRLLKLILDAELPVPITNVKVAGQLVDMLWPALGLVVEFDGWEFHRTRPAFERDRVRDQVLTAAGLQVLRVTARHVDVTPYALVARVASVIATRRISQAGLAQAPSTRALGCP